MRIKLNFRFYSMHGANGAVPAVVNSEHIQAIAEKPVRLGKSAVMMGGNWHDVDEEADYIVAKISKKAVKNVVNKDDKKDKK